MSRTPGQAAIAKLVSGLVIALLGGVLVGLAGGPLWASVAVAYLAFWTEW